MSQLRTDALPRDGVLLLSGYGLRVAVERGHLVVEDGVGAARREGRFARADRELRRLVVLGHAGTISLDALRWLFDVGVGFAHIDTDGQVVAASGPVGLRDARLRRAQALAPSDGRGLEIARELVQGKIAGQVAVLGRLVQLKDADSVLAGCLDRLDTADSIDRLRVIEAEAAAAYWSAWAGVELRFARREAKRIPRHWLTFGKRASRVTGNPRKATNPANAILNYLYSILEAEARIAAIAVGLDPGLGVMHADLRSRDSLASDLMEPARPRVDARLLDLLEKRAFVKQDFFETREGVCRVMPPLPQLLAETAARWTEALAPVAERVAQVLMADGELATPLTQAKRSAGRRQGGKPKPRAAKRPGIAATCAVCGASLRKGRRRYCSSCRPEQVRNAVAEAHMALQAKRDAGRDPAHGGEAGRRRGRSNAAVLRANAAWERDQAEVQDPAIFTTEILPRLSGVPLAEMMRATGLSRPYCAMIRRGERAPHARHWETLSSLAD
jgi:CRISPR-associated endonuclease Cas1